jgi:hypothetical protein
VRTAPGQAMMCVHRTSHEGEWGCDENFVCVSARGINTSGYVIFPRHSVECSALTWGALSFNHAMRALIRSFVTLFLVDCTVVIAHAQNPGTANCTTAWFSNRIDQYSWRPTPTGKTHYQQRYLWVRSSNAREHTVHNSC